MRRFKTQVREIRHPLRAEEATALREAERQAQAQDDSGSQEDAPQAFGGDGGRRRNLRRHGGRRRPRALELRRRPPPHFLPGPNAARKGGGSVSGARVRRDRGPPAASRRRREASRFRSGTGGSRSPASTTSRPSLDALADAGGVGSPEDFRPIVARGARDARPCAAPREGGHAATSPRAASALPALRSRCSRTPRALRRGRDCSATTPRRSSRRSAREAAPPARRGLAHAREASRRRGARPSATRVVVLRNDRYCLPVLASARGRVPGIVHDRSGSGQTVFVEPLEVIEANNDLALLAAEERREVERLLARVRARRPRRRRTELRDAVGALAALDALEAKVAFGEIGEGRLPGDLGRRHLDARAARAIRCSTPASSRCAAACSARPRDGRDAVPLDLELAARPAAARRLGPQRRRQDGRAEDRRPLLDARPVRHPDARGAGTRLPVFRVDPHRDRRRPGDPLGPLDVLLLDGDASPAILAGGRARRARPDRRDRRRDGSRRKAARSPSRSSRRSSSAAAGRSSTTHLSGDQELRRRRAPTRSARRWSSTRRPGGRTTASTRASRAAAARSRSPASAGIPEPCSTRAREILGEAWERRERAETDAEQALERLRAARRRSSAAERDARRGARPSASRAERRKLGRGARADARRGARRLRAGAAASSRARSPRSSTRRARRRRGSRRPPPRAFSRRPSAPPRPSPSSPRRARPREARSRERRASAHAARVRGSGARARVVAFDGDWAQLEVRGKRLRVRRAELEPVARQAGAGRRKARAADPRPTVDRSASRDVAGPTVEVNVIGQRLEEAHRGGREGARPGAPGRRGAPARHPRPRDRAGCATASASTSAATASVGVAPVRAIGTRRRQRRDDPANCDRLLRFWHVRSRHQRRRPRRAAHRAADIVEVIGDHTRLKKAGRSWKGLCPFHNERTPSFTVDRDKGLYHCFGCGAGGDVIHFVRQIDRLEFPEAVEALASRFGVTIPRRERRGPREDRRDRLFEAVAAAAALLRASGSSEPGNTPRRSISRAAASRPSSGRRCGLGHAARRLGLARQGALGAPSRRTC